MTERMRRLIDRAESCGVWIAVAVVAVAVLESLVFR